MSEKKLNQTMNKWVNKTHLDWINGLRRPNLNWINELRTPHLDHEKFS